jgi:hypothetical protein
MKQNTHATLVILTILAAVCISFYPRISQAEQDAVPSKTNSVAPLADLPPPADASLSSPKRWLDLATLIGRRKDEIDPEITIQNMYVKHPSTTIPSPIPGSNKNPDVPPERMRYMALIKHQKRLSGEIKSLTDNLIYNAHQAQFDDDSKRTEFKKQLAKLARLSEGEFKILDSDGRMRKEERD